MSGAHRIHSNRIHPGAWIDPEAELGQGNVIGPGVYIEAGTRLGDGNVIHAHAVIRRGTSLGNDNQVFEHAVLGGPPQDLGFDPAIASGVVIGDRNVLREGVTVHRATRAGEATRLGDDNYLMTHVHVGHDGVLGSRVIMAAQAALAGFVEVADRAFISGGVMIHQFARVGRLAMIGGNAKITRDVPPFCLVDGVPARTRGLNLVGLRRAGFDTTELRALKTAYRTLFRSHRPLEQALAELEATAAPPVQQLAAFIRSSRRGFHRDRDS